MPGKQLSVQHYVRDVDVQKRIASLLGDRVGSFTTSLMSVVNNNARLAQCKPETVINAALTATTLDLPINPNLGFAAIVPYKNYGVDEAQFQIMVKGFIQLAQRSGQYKTISATPVYEGQLVSVDPLKGMVWDWNAPSTGTPVGYAAYFSLLNGFEKTFYMSTQQVEAHGKRYSKTFANGPWKDNFEGMALKTVLKLVISRFGPMSVDMQQAVRLDQAIIHDDDNIEYADRDEMEGEKATEEEKKAIVDAFNGEEEAQAVTPEDAMEVLGGEIVEDEEESKGETKRMFDE